MPLHKWLRSLLAAQLVELQPVKTRARQLSEVSSGSGDIGKKKRLRLKAIEKA